MVKEHQTPMQRITKILMAELYILFVDFINNILIANNGYKWPSSMTNQPTRGWDYITYVKRGDGPLIKLVLTQVGFAWFE